MDRKYKQAHLYYFSGKVITYKIYNCLTIRHNTINTDLKEGVVMNFYTVRDLRTQPKEIWEKLSESHELIITKKWEAKRIND